MIVAVEDGLSEAVVRKLISAIRPDLHITNVLGLRGKGYLQNRARELDRAAAAIPILMLTDQDRAEPCPADIRAEWFGSRPLNVLFRVAVMEIESWVLADRDRIAAMLGVPVHRIPLDTDGIPQPKEFLVNLARRSRFSAIRQDLVPAPRSTAAVGPFYNPRMIAFVSEQWRPKDAAAISRSLARSMDRLTSTFAART